MIDENIATTPNAETATAESNDAATDAATTTGENTATPPVPPATVSESGATPPKPVTENKPTAAKPANRLTMVLNASGENQLQIQQVADERIKAGISQNYGHFLLQCVDFAINHAAVKNSGNVDISFGVPDAYQAKLLKNGFYAQFPNIKIETCK